MQPILGNPRAGLNQQAIIDLLSTDPSITVTYGAEWYNSDLVFVDDVSSYMSSGSTISSDVNAAIHRSCSLVFDSDVPFNYITDFIKPYMILTNNDTGFAARFNLGVYTLQTPQMDNSTTPSVLTFTGYDLLYLLDQAIGDSYEVQVGVDPVDMAAALIGTAVPFAQIKLVESGETTAQVYTWPFDSSDVYTYLDVVNALLKMVGYSPIWVDWDGLFRCEPFIDPQLATVEWTFDLTANDNIVAEQRSSIQDFFDVPNYWLFIVQNLTTAPVEGVTQVTYVDTAADNPSSFTNRGRYVKSIYFVDATSYAALFTQAVVQITSDLTPAETFSVSTSPLPLAWHKDIIAMVDPALEPIPPTKSATRRCQANQWDITLDGTADMTWTLQTVNTVTPTTG